MDLIGKLIMWLTYSSRWLENEMLLLAEDTFIQNIGSCSERKLKIQVCQFWNAETEQSFTHRRICLAVPFEVPPAVFQLFQFSSLLQLEYGQVELISAKLIDLLSNEQQMKFPYHIALYL